MNDHALSYIAIISISGLIYSTIFYYTSKIERNYVNILTFNFLINLPTLYFFPLVGVIISPPTGSIYAYAYIYACIVAAQLFFVASFFASKPRYLQVNILSTQSSVFFALILTAVSAMLFLSLAISTFGLNGIFDCVTNPRSLYLLTRSGSGAFFFVSSTISSVAVILLLFLDGRTILRYVLAFVNIFMLYLHGSKGLLFSILFIYLYFQAYIVGISFRSLRFFWLVIAFGTIGFGVFGFLQRNINVTGSVFDQMVSYSDYIPNSAMLIDSDLPAQLGRLTLENNIISIIPRPLWPGKPKDFGSLYLAEKFYPEWFERDTGAPAFLFGAAIADFKQFAIIYICLINGVIGYIAKVFYNRSQRTKSVLDFTLFISFAGLNIISVGIGWPFPELFAAMLVLGVFLSLRIKRSSQRGLAQTLQ